MITHSLNFVKPCFPREIGLFLLYFKILIRLMYQDKESAPKKNKNLSALPLGAPPIGGAGLGFLQRLFNFLAPLLLRAAFKNSAPRAKQGGRSAPKLKSPLNGGLIFGRIKHKS